MGYLDNTSVTVDAILTKKGREALSQGRNSFQITRFALGDDEVDYTLWNPAHSLGSSPFNILSLIPQKFFEFAISFKLSLPNTLKFWSSITPGIPYLSEWEKDNPLVISVLQQGVTIPLGWVARCIKGNTQAAVLFKSCSTSQSMLYFVKISFL